MNLLLEQRPTSVKSSKSQPISSTLLVDQSNEYDVNSSSSSSSLVLKLKRQTTTTTTSQASRMTGEDNEEHDDQQQTRSTRMKQRSHPSSSSSSSSSTTMATTTVRRPSSPAFNGKQQQQQQQQTNSKRSITIDNNNNDLSSHLDDISSSKRFKSDQNHTSSSNKVDASVETVSVGLATEPDHLGPCEPGTSVVLEGIVWNETDSGVLVVNVTWRGKTYVGTLLDSTKQDWACPRLTCESPTSDYDPRSSSKTSRTKRTTAGGTNRSTNPSNSSVSSFQQITSIILSSGIDERRLRNNVKPRQSKRLNQLSNTNNEENSTASPSPLASPHRTNQSFFPSETATTTATGNSEGQLIPCSEANCHKRFTSTVALSYHLSDAHKKTSSSSSSSSSSSLSSSSASSTPIVSQANRRDEEDVAHILANVAHYARRASPPPVTSPERQVLPTATATTTTSNSTPLSWPCPQISSNLVQTSSLNNDERQKLPTEKIYFASNILDNPPPATSLITTTTTTTNESDSKTTDRKSPLSSSTDPSPWNGEKKDRNNNKKRSKTTPVPPTTSSTFVPISLPSSIPLTSTSPAYSDISDEESTTTTTTNESILPPSTINLLSGTHSNIEDKTSPTSTFLPSNPDWTAQMLFQQFSPYISQSTLVPTPTTSIVPSTNKETTKSKRSTTPNGLNSKNHCSPTNNDSTVKNILDARRSSTIKSGSTSISPPMNLYHFHSNGTTTNPNEPTTKFSPSIINTLTSPNENLLHPSTNNTTSNSSSTTTITPTTTPPSTLKPMEILDFSLNPSNGQYAHSSSLHPSR